MGPILAFHGSFNRVVVNFDSTFKGKEQLIMRITFILLLIVLTYTNRLDLKGLISYILHLNFYFMVT